MAESQQLLYDVNECNYHERCDTRRGMMAVSNNATLKKKIII